MEFRQCTSSSRLKSREVEFQNDQGPLNILLEMKLFLYQSSNHTLVAKHLLQLLKFQTQGMLALLNISLFYFNVEPNGFATDSSNSLLLPLDNIAYTLLSIVELSGELSELQKEIYVSIRHS